MSLSAEEMELSGGNAVLGGGGGKGESERRYPTIVKFPTQGGSGVKGVSF